jgi:hypothetical protein
LAQSGSSVVYFLRDQHSSIEITAENAMNKVYLHRSMAPDEYLGRVDDRGRVYEARFGPDKYIGRIDLQTGRIYEAQLGPDHHLGDINLENGRVTLGRFGPDEYYGRVAEDGKLFLQARLAPDDYIGKVVEMVSLAHGGAALLLLVRPVLD